MKLQRLFLPLWIFFISVIIYPSHSENIGDYIPSRCSSCNGLNECSSLNGYQLPDPIVGYSRIDDTSRIGLPAQGVCLDMDKKAQKLDLFNIQFHDTWECRLLVHQFHCLVWGSTNNTCTINPVLPPCRSICIKVAEQCVYMNYYRTYLDEVCSQYSCNQTVPCIGYPDTPDDVCSLNDNYNLPGLSLTIKNQISTSMLFVIIGIILFLI